MKDIDYTTVIVEDVLGLISSDKNPWPSNFTKVRKLKLLTLCWITARLMKCTNIVKQYKALKIRYSVKVILEKRKSDCYIGYVLIGRPVFCCIESDCQSAVNKLLEYVKKTKVF
jgi:hypothetical protein